MTGLSFRGACGTYSSYLTATNYEGVTPPKGDNGTLRRGNNGWQVSPWI